MAIDEIGKIRRQWVEGDREGALVTAARLNGLGKERDAIQRGRAAQMNPELYRQMGKDPEALVARGIEAVRRRFDIK